MSTNSAAFTVFADACFSAYAALPTAPVVRWVDFRACRLHLQFIDDVPVSAFMRAITHRQIAAPESPHPTDLTVWITDRHTSGLQLPKPFWQWASLPVSGVVPDVDPALGVAMYHSAGHRFTLLDRVNNRAIIWANDLRDMPEWEHSFPFRNLLHHYLAPTPWLMVHAGAVGNEWGGVLLTGAGGAGKSTASLACLDAGLDYAGDDFVLIDTGTGYVHSLYHVAKIDADNLNRFPHWQPLVANHASLPTQKGQLFVQEHLPARIRLQFPLRAIGLPQFSGAANTTLQPATAAEALRAMGPSTMELLAAGPETFVKMARLATRFPAFRLNTGTDLAQIPRAVQQLLASLPNPAPVSGAVPANQAGVDLPLISVVMSVYNTAPFVAEAIASVLAQAHDALELICIDDGSTDDSAAIIEQINDPRIRLIRQPNQGSIPTLNRGLREAAGEFITFLDSDDWWAADKLTRQLAVLQADSSLLAVLGKTKWVFMPGVSDSNYKFPDESQEAFDMILGASLFRRKVFDIVGLFDTRLRTGHDYDWYNRLREQRIRLQTIDEVVLFYRRHKHNLTNDKDLIGSQTARLLKMSLDRRRAQAGQTTLPLPPLTSLS